MKTIFLCGFMGSGKSTVAKELSRAYKLSFIDLDEYIVEREKMSIPDIFSQKGEGYFRKIEAISLKETADKYAVIATGGGTILNYDSARTASEIGTVFFIDADFEVCYSRIKNDKNRPLVVNNTEEELKKIFDIRRTIYIKNSDITIDGSSTPQKIAEEIMNTAK